MTKLIQCPYCLASLYEPTAEYYTTANLHWHMNHTHPEKNYRSIKDLIEGWKMIGLYEEKDDGEEKKKI